MATDGKWIDGLHAGMGAIDAARLALEMRLQAVASRLPQAAKQAGEDVEHVHQLRVATRRAAAALRTFAILAPGKPLRRVRRKLKRLRHAAGDARDWDVFLLGLVAREKVAAARRAGLDFLIGFAQGRRQAAQAALLEAHEEVATRFEQASAALLERLRLPNDMPKRLELRDLAAPHLSALLRELEEAAAADLADYENLHAIRIVGKRLRYA